MRLILEQSMSKATLRCPSTPLDPKSLVHLLDNIEGELGDPGSDSFETILVQRGGEAWIRLYGATVLRFEMKLLLGQCSQENCQKYEKKFHRLKQLLPDTALKPNQLLYIEDSPMVVGHTLTYAPNYQSLGKLPKDMEAEALTKVLMDLHSFIFQCHERGIVLGEVNPTNFGLSNGKFVAIDTMAFGLKEDPCTSACRPTLDPKLLVQDENILDRDELASKRALPYTIDSDWYSFACIVLELLVGLGPWDGVYRSKSSKDLKFRRKRVLSLRGLSIFSRSIEIANLGELKRSPEAISEPLYNYLYEVFNKRVRGPFPIELLAGIRWVKCHKCGTTFSSRKCPCGSSGFISQIP